MQISNLIWLLEMYRNAHGDLEIYLPDQEDGLAVLRQLEVIGGGFKDNQGEKILVLRGME